MNGVQHKIVGTGAGIATSMVLTAKSNDPLAVLIVGASIVGCMLPDIDHDKTKIGSKRKMITTVGNTLFNIVVYGGITLAIIAGLVLVWAVTHGLATSGVNITNLIIAGVGLLVVAIAKKMIENSKSFKWAAKHRGLMHTLVVPTIGIILYFASPSGLWRHLILGLLIGYLSHLFADCQTIEGCPIMFPLTCRNLKFMTLKTKSKICTLVAYIDAAIFVAIAYYFAT